MRAPLIRQADPPQNMQNWAKKASATLTLRHATRPQKTPFTIIYSHGNAEDLGINYIMLQQLGFSLKCDVFAYEYPGESRHREHREQRE